MSGRNSGGTARSGWYCPGCRTAPDRTRALGQPIRRCPCPLCCGYTDVQTAARNRRVHERDLARQRELRRFRAQAPRGAA